MLKDTIIEYIASHWVASKAQHLVNIYITLVKAYESYDTSILEAQIYLTEDVETSSDMVSDTVLEMLSVDAISYLALNGIIVSPSASLSTIDALCQLTLVGAEDDMDDLASIAKDMDAVEAIANLASIIAEPGDWGEGYSVDFIIQDIESVDPFCIEKLIAIFTGEEIIIPLTEGQHRFAIAYPESIIAEMISPPSVLTRGGNLITYQHIFSEVIEETSAGDLPILFAGMILVSNTPPEAYTVTVAELVSTYVDPQALSRILSLTNSILKEALNESTRIS